MLNRIFSPLTTAAPSRRGFLKLSAGTAGGLLIGLHLPGSASIAEAAAPEGMIQPFVHVLPDNTVVVLSKHLDKGQGVATGLATLVADEMDADWAQVRAEFAPANAELYKNLFFGAQGTGGSTAIANSFMQYRTAGAAARSMLVQAAAKAWSVPASEVTISAGRISHSSGKSATFGEMAGLAAAEAVPAEPRLKTPDEWVYIGKSFKRVDTARKSTGAAGVYGMDQRFDNMLTAVLARPPRFGSKVASVDDSAARAIAGVVDVITVPSGVAVLANGTWQAMQGRDALSVTWDDSAAEMRSTAEMEAELAALTGKPGTAAEGSTDAEPLLAGAARIIEADYMFPFLAHAPMEPLDITVLYDGSSATFWTGSQFQTTDQVISAGILGLTPDKVAINTLWAGGSFGRRAQPDSHYFAEAALIAKARHEAGHAPQPLKIVWTREDDIRGGYYRPMTAHKVKVGLDEAGRITGWQHRIAGKSIMKGTGFEAFAVKNGVDDTMVEGVHGTTYGIPGFQLEAHMTSTPVPVLWWRSVGHTHTAYVVETMIDRIARETGADPVAFRESLIKDDPRKLAVLRLAAEKAGWDTPLPEGRYRGVAVHTSFNSHVAEVAEISFRDDGTVKVEKVVCAVDCGIPVNPDNIRAQVEGAVGYGLGAVLRNEITLTEGEVDQSNFDTYLPLRMSDMPVIEVHIVPSEEAPTGIGEPGTPPIGPAVANAIAAARGDYVTVLPFSKHGLA